MRLARTSASDARPQCRFEPRDRYRDALRIEIVGAKECLLFSSFFELQRLETKPDNCGCKRRAVEFGAQHLEHRAIVRGRRCKRYVESRMCRRLPARPPDGACRRACRSARDRCRCARAACAERKRPALRRRRDLLRKSRLQWQRHGRAARRDVDRRRARARASSPPPHRNDARMARAANERDRRAARCRAAVVARLLPGRFRAASTAAATTARVPYPVPRCLRRRRTPPLAPRSYSSPLRFASSIQNVPARCAPARSELARHRQCRACRERRGRDERRRRAAKRRRAHRASPPRAREFHR